MVTKVERNEKRKLTATLLNSTSVSLLGAAVLGFFGKWIMAGSSLLVLLVLIGAALGLHLAARTALGGLED